MTNVQEKIEGLRSKLHQYNFEYYVNDTSLISDFEFDQKQPYQRAHIQHCSRL